MKNMIPCPRKAEIKEGFLCITPVYTTEEEDFKDCIHAFSEMTDRIWGLSLSPLDAPMVDEKFMTPLTEGGTECAEEKKTNLMELPGEERTDKGIYIKKDISVPEGGCRIHSGDTCVIMASGTEGLMRAFSLILQISERTCDKYIKIPKCDITDEPDTPFRGFLLDAARRWHPVDYLYKYVDICALFGINRFIIHFTDDESFTLPSEVFPLLPTENRHYKKEELRALDSYAKARGVMIVPEIDMPGHCAQFAVKYPEVFGKCGIMDADEEVFDSLHKLYKEAAELFPDSKFIHVGGDEAVLGRWGDSERTKAYMEKNGIEDFMKLYGHFVGRVCDGILKLGRTPIVWEGFGKDSNDLVSKDVLVIAWESHYQLAPELVEAGFRILNASWKPLYVVSPWRKWSQDEILSWNKYTWDHWWEGSVAYKNKIVIPKDSPVDGGMLCAWGDYLKGYESSRLACQLEFASVMPRLASLAERLWNDESPDPDCFKPSYEHAVRLTERLFGEHPFRGVL